MKLEAGDSPAGLTEPEQIDAMVALAEGWKGPTLARLRDCIRRADPGILEEVKWRKPSRPMGVPVWSRNGIVCVADILKSAVRLTFPKGAALDGPLWHLQHSPGQPERPSRGLPGGRRSQ
jgi:hypothetical protein